MTPGDIYNWDEEQDVQTGFPSLDPPYQASQDHMEVMIIDLCPKILDTKKVDSPR